MQSSRRAFRLARLARLARTGLNWPEPAELGTIVPSIVPSNSLATIVPSYNIDDKRFPDPIYGAALTVSEDDHPHEPESYSQRSAADHNQRAWDSLVRHGRRFTRAAKDEEFENPLATLDGNGWLGENIRGKRLLCLAAGGGRHGPLYAATGAEVTVVDISPSQLELDRQVAAERNVRIRTVQTSMDDLSMFQPHEFDIVIHPVATCYLPNIADVYSAVARMTCPNGLYISQHKQPVSLQSSTEFGPHGYSIQEPYYGKQPLTEVRGSLHREEGTLEFLHRWEELVGFLCRSGFVVEDLVEPRHADLSAPAGSFAHRSHFIAPYVRIKARRLATNADSNPVSSTTVWLPDR